jgi:hypothetical protein
VPFGNFSIVTVGKLDMNTVRHSEQFVPAESLEFKGGGGEGQTVSNAVQTHRSWSSSSVTYSQIRPVATVSPAGRKESFDYT